MAKLGLPVPPGFTVRAEASELKGKLTDAMRKEVRSGTFSCLLVKTVGVSLACP